MRAPLYMAFTIALALVLVGAPSAHANYYADSSAYKPYAGASPTQESLQRQQQNPSQNTSGYHTYTNLAECPESSLTDAIGQTTRACLHARALGQRSGRGACPEFAATVMVMKNNQTMEYMAPVPAAANGQTVVVSQAFGKAGNSLNNLKLTYFCANGTSVAMNVEAPCGTQIKYLSTHSQRQQFEQFSNATGAASGACATDTPAATSSDGSCPEFIAPLEYITSNGGAAGSVSGTYTAKIPSAANGQIVGDPIFDLNNLTPMTYTTDSDTSILSGSLNSIVSYQCDKGIWTAIGHSLPCNTQARYISTFDKARGNADFTVATGSGCALTSSKTLCISEGARHPVVGQEAVYKGSSTWWGSCAYADKTAPYIHTDGCTQRTCLGGGQFGLQIYGCKPASECYGLLNANIPTTPETATDLSYNTVMQSIGTANALGSTLRCGAANKAFAIASKNAKKYLSNTDDQSVHAELANAEIIVSRCTSRQAEEVNEAPGLRATLYFAQRAIGAAQAWNCSAAQGELDAALDQTSLISGGVASIHSRMDTEDPNIMINQAKAALTKCLGARNAEKTTP